MKPLYYYSTIISLALIISLSLACTKQNFDQNSNAPAKVSVVISVEEIDTLEVKVNQWISMPDNIYRSPLNIPEELVDSFPLSVIMGVYINNNGSYQKVGENSIDYMDGKLWFISYVNSLNTANYLFFQPAATNIPFESIDFRVIVTQR